MRVVEKVKRTAEFEGLFRKAMLHASPQAAVEPERTVLFRNGLVRIQGLAPFLLQTKTAWGSSAPQGFRLSVLPPFLIALSPRCYRLMHLLNVQVPRRA